MIASGDDGSPLKLTGEPLRTVLSHRYRRRTVRCLASADETLHLADLARDVARAADESSGKTIAEDDVDRVYVRLYHIHLPRLREAGVVSFDAETKLVSPAPATDRIASSLPGGDDW